MKITGWKRRLLVRVLVPLGAGLAITLGGLAGVALVLGVPLMAPGPLAEASADTTGAVAPGSDADIVMVGPPDRNVTPAGVTPGPRVEGPLLRVERTVTDITLGTREPEALFRRVVVLDAGSFRSVVDDRPVTVRLAGIAAPGFRDECMDEEGRVWKCGARARAELARLIVNRSVACVIPDDADPDSPTGRCRVGLFDVSEWLVQNGWADPGEGADQALVDLHEQAKRSRRGRYGPAPQGVIAG